MFFLAIYCLAISALHHSFAQSGTLASKTASETTLVADIPMQLLSHTSKSGSAFSQISTNSPGFKNPFSDFGVIVSVTEHLLASTYCQYEIFSRNLLIHHRKADILFPFHYFW